MAKTFIEKFSRKFANIKAVAVFEYLAPKIPDIRYLRAPTKRQRTAILSIFYLFVFFSYFAYGLQFTGPAVLSDEIGYLTKAAAIAGHITDSASSWQAGYALLISPAFIFFSDPDAIWKAIMAMNAFMFTLSFMLLFQILKSFFPKKNFWSLIGAVAVVAIYPAWITMSGYAFSTPAFVLCFLIVTRLFLAVGSKKVSSVILLALAGGFLFWIHPIGLAVMAALLLSILVQANSKKDLGRIAVFILISVVMLILYTVFHAWLSKEVTPEGYLAAAHYDTINSSLSRLLSYRFWLRCFLTAFGHMSYVLISTLGIIAFSFVTVISRVKKNFRTNKTLDTESGVLLFLALSVLGVTLMGSLMFNLYELNQLRLDQRIYGRYSEMVLLPLLGIGILSRWRLKATIFVLAGLIITGIAHHFYVSEANTSEWLVPLNIMSFWPRLFYEEPSFLHWFMIGSFGVLIAKLLGKRFIILLILPLFILSASAQYAYHGFLLNDFRQSKPTGLVDVARSGMLNDHCIAFEPKQPRDGYLKLRIRMYSFYLYDYRLQRMTANEWLQSDCGAYLAFDITPFQQMDNVRFVGKGEMSGLYLISKTENLNMDIQYQNHDLPGFYANTDPATGGLCVLRGCFISSASDLKDFVEAGVLNGNTISTNGSAGSLFSGPYAGLRAGNYVVKLEGDFTSTEGSYIEISDKDTGKVYKTQSLNAFGNNKISIPFVVTEDILRVDIRLVVSSESEIVFKKYVIDVN